MRLKRPSPPAAIVDRALALAAEGWTGAAIDRELGLEARSETSEIQAISDAALAAIVRDLFGSQARIESIARLAPLATHGIERRGGFTGNLVYALSFARPRRKLVLRFNRGLRGDVYDAERENYALVESATGIRGPEILRIDRSCRLVPTEYMAMELIEGELGTYLAHPGNPELDPAEKGRVRQATGRFYAALHDRKRPAPDDALEARRFLFGLYRLRDAAGTAGLDAERIGACIRAVAAEPALRSATESLCFMDGELLFARRGRHWEPAFVCDLEWVCYRDACADLVPQLCPTHTLLALSSPGISGKHLRAARDDAFFQAYGQTHAVDWARLSALMPYYQLSLWSHAVADQPDDAARKALLRQRGELLDALVSRILS